ncbi:MAG: hypothetical protein HY897_01305 [Deltaproteobacteria bacterium]|nr:hypothetical protein [Deltaproteobacteria bacterium]
MERQPLDPAKVPPILRKYIGEAVPSGLKMVAARGMVPLKPVELVTLLYCFHFDADPQVQEAAMQGIRGLPPPVVNAVVDAPLDPQLLDLLAEAYADRPDILSRIILNRNTSDDTIVMLAQTAGEETINLIANNQVRFLRTPEIIKFMYSNPFAKQATLDNVIEFARRSGVDVDALLGIGEPVEAEEGGAPGGEGAEPAGGEAGGAEIPAGAHAAPQPGAGGEDGPGDLAAKVPACYLEPKREFSDAENKQFIAWMETAPEDVLVRLAQYGNASSGVLLAKSKNRTVAMALLKNKNLDLMRHWTKIAADRQGNDELIKYMCTKKDFTNVYAVKSRLALNPKTPVSNSMGFVRSMRLSDLKNVARNKAIAVTLQNTAKSILKMHGVKVDDKGAKPSGGH